VRLRCIHHIHKAVRDKETQQKVFHRHRGCHTCFSYQEPGSEWCNRGTDGAIWSYYKDYLPAAGLTSSRGIPVSLTISGIQTLPHPSSFFQPVEKRYHDPATSCWSCYPPLLNSLASLEEPTQAASLTTYLLHLSLTAELCRRPGSVKATPPLHGFPRALRMTRRLTRRSMLLTRRW
jgi:hypothetical protein